MNKFQTGDKWLRSDGKVCVLTILSGFIADQDGVYYFADGSSNHHNLVSRIISDDETVQMFIDSCLESDNEQWQIVAKRIQAQSKLLEELKQLIADSGEKGAAMIKRIEQL